MATYRKKGSGVEVAVCVNGIRRSRTFPNKTRAKSWAADMERQLAGLSDGVSTKDSLGDLFRRYAEEVSEHKRGARWEILRLNAFQRHSIAKVKLIDLKREHIQSWINDRQAVVSNASINRELNLISACLTEARRWGLMTHKPMADIKRLKNPPPRDRLITPDEINRLLPAMNYDDQVAITQQKQRVAVAMLFAIETAMRAGEICSLHPRHINRQTRVATLEQTKNGDARRVPISTRALALLDQLDRWDLDEPLFNLNSALLSATFRKAVKSAGIENLCFHDTRHEAITRLAKKMDVLALARVVGHRDIKQLQTYYNESAEDLAKLLK